MFLWVSLRKSDIEASVNLEEFVGLKIRYYSIFLLVFDVVQIHLFARPGITSDIVFVDDISSGLMLC